MPAHPDLIAKKLEEMSIPEPNSGCRLWYRSTTKDGYGNLTVGNKRHRAHRLSYQIHVGPIPAGLLVCHRCHVRCCINPDHLYVGTQFDNMADMVRIGNSTFGERSKSAILTEESAKRALIMVFVKVKSRVSVAAYFGVSGRTISAICRGEQWKHLKRPDMIATPERRLKKSRTDFAFAAILAGATNSPDLARALKVSVKEASGYLSYLAKEGHIRWTGRIVPRLTAGVRPKVYEVVRYEAD